MAPAVAAPVQVPRPVYDGVLRRLERGGFETGCRCKASRAEVGARRRVGAPGIVVVVDGVIRPLQRAPRTGRAGTPPYPHVTCEV